MVKRNLLIVAVVMLLAVGLAAQGKVVKIEDIRQTPTSFQNEVVIVEGVVVQFVAASAKTTAFYYLKGDWGGVIMVRSAYSTPAVGKRYQVNGVLDIDAAVNEPFITEMNRKETEAREGVIGSQDVPSVTKSGSDETSPLVNERPKTLIYILGAAAVVILFLLFFVLFSLRKRSNIHAYVTPVPSHDIPEPEKVIEGSTIKMSVPPAGTLKLLPGRLKVVAGDETVKEIRFYRLPNSEEVELTFGRGPGKPFSHISLKPMTVSAKQARIVGKDGKYFLTNYSKTNPTLVNGVALPIEQATELKNNDRIEMGEVAFEFLSE